MVGVTVFGVSAITLIIAIVQVLKVKMGMPVALAPYVALGLSFVASGIAYAVQFYPETSGLFEYLVGAITVWIAVTGTYEKGKDAGVPGLRK
jgi:hypothetical protein